MDNIGGASVCRVETGWRLASKEESYEIARRRLFKQIPDDRLAESRIDASGFWGAVEGYATTALESPRGSLSLNMDGDLESAADCGVRTAQNHRCSLCRGHGCGDRL